MKKQAIIASLLLISFKSGAQQCEEPSQIINYLPLGTTQEFCFEAEIDIATRPVSVNMRIDSDNRKSITLNAFEEGVFTNMIVLLKDGSRREFNVLTLEQPKVERVHIVKIEQ